MSFQKFKSGSYCVGLRQGSATTKIYGDITSKFSKVLFGFCSICNRKKSMVISDNTIQAEGINNFFENRGRNSAKAGKKLATNVLKNPGRALDNTANIATAAASGNSIKIFSTLPEVINFYHTGKGLYLPGFI